VAEDGHERLQAHPGVGQFGGVGVPQLVRGDVERPPAGAGQAGRCRGAAQAGADAPGFQSSAVVGEQEVGGVAGARVWVWPLLASVVGPGVQRGHGVRVERNGALGAELAQWHAQPGAGRPVVDDAAEFEVEALAQAQAGAA